MSDLPVLMEIELPSLAGGYWERPRGARFFLSLIVWFFLYLFCLLVKLGARVWNEGHALVRLGLVNLQQYPVKEASFLEFDCPFGSIAPCWVVHSWCGSEC